MRNNFEKVGAVLVASLALIASPTTPNAAVPRNGEPDRENNAPSVTQSLETQITLLFNEFQTKCEIVLEEPEIRVLKIPDGIYAGGKKSDCVVLSTIRQPDAETKSISLTGIVYEVGQDIETPGIKVVIDSTSTDGMFRASAGAQKHPGEAISLASVDGDGFCKGKTEKNIVRLAKPACDSTLSALARIMDELIKKMTKKLEPSKPIERLPSPFVEERR